MVTVLCERQSAPSSIQDFASRRIDVLHEKGFLVRAGIGNAEAQRAQRREHRRGTLDWISLYLRGLCDCAFCRLVCMRSFETRRRRGHREGSNAGVDWIGRACHLRGLCDSAFDRLYGFLASAGIGNTESQRARRGTIAGLSPCRHASNGVRVLHRSFLEGQSR